MAPNKYKFLFLIISILLYSKIGEATEDTDSQCFLYSFENDMGDISWIKTCSKENIDVPWNSLSSEARVGMYSLSSGKQKEYALYNMTMNVEGPGNISFWWRKNDYFNMQTKLYLSIDGRNIKTYSESDHMWAFVDPIHIDSGSHNIIWILQIYSQFSKEGRLPNAEAEAFIDEIKFCKSIHNFTPRIVTLLPDKECPQEVNSIICWEVEANDPEGDQLKYNFFHNNSSMTGWIDDNRWNWRTSLDNIGNNSIKVCIRDGKHPGQFDECKLVNYSIAFPKLICRLEAPNSTCFCSGNAIVSLNCIGNNLRYDWSVIGANYSLNSPIGNSISLNDYECKPIKIIGNVTVPSGTKSNYYHIISVEPCDNQDVVVVKPGSNLSELISRSENKTLCLENGDYRGGFIINVKNLKIKAKNIKGARIISEKPDYNIVIDNTSNVDIEGIDLLESPCGIILFNSTYCDIKNNTIAISSKAGIHIELSSYNNITGNNITASSSGYGVNITRSDHNKILNNIITTQGFAYAIDVFSICNTVSSIGNSCIYCCSDETKCKIDPYGRLKCTDHCSIGPLDDCVSCDQINETNKWSCIND